MDRKWAANDLTRWVRQQMGLGSGPRGDEVYPDHYDGDGDQGQGSSTQGHLPSGIGCMTAIVIATLVVGGGLYFFFDGDDDTATTVGLGDDIAQVDEADEVDEVDDGVDEVESDEGSGDTTDEPSDTTDESDGDSDVSVPDSLARIESVGAVIDEKGQVWIVIEFAEGWARLTPDEFFSLFWSLFVTFNPTVELGWQTHDGVETVLGTTSEAYILDDGRVLMATGLFPTRPFELTIEASFGSWESEDGPPAVFGEASMSIDSESIEDGDPFVHFGAETVFDLVAGS